MIRFAPYAVQFLSSSGWFHLMSAIVGQSGFFNLGLEEGLAKVQEAS